MYDIWSLLILWLWISLVHTMLLRYWIGRSVGRSVGLLKSWLHTFSYRSVIFQTLLLWQLYWTFYQLLLSCRPDCVYSEVVYVHLTWASECPDVKNYKWRLNPVWHRMLYSCTHMATVCFKGLNCQLVSFITWSKSVTGDRHLVVTIVC